MYCNCLFPMSTLSFQSSCFSTWPKSQAKNLNILRTKRPFKVNKKHFSFLKGFQLPKIVSDLKVRFCWRNTHYFGVIILNRFKGKIDLLSFNSSYNLGQFLKFWNVYSGKATSHMLSYPPSGIFYSYSQYFDCYD